MTAPTPPSTSTSGRPPRGPLALLALMTVATLIGPVLVAWIVGGGVERRWPPDRPVEWVALLGVVGAVMGLMIALLRIGLTNHRAIKSSQAASLADTTTEAGA